MDREKVLSLTPDELFEKFSIKEILQIKKVFMDEIKSIKDTLRSVINEKYEDFIEATGKVDEMKTNDISGQIDYIHELYANIADSKWFNDRIELVDEKNRESVYVAAVLIKLLIDITEQVWCAIDCCDYISAILLIQLCGHIKTVLEIDANLNLRSMFPIVYEKRNVIIQFPIILINRIENTLINTSIEPEDCNKCLCGLMILENLSTTNLLDRLLVLRSNALEHCFKKGRNVKQNQSVKANIADGLQIVFTTLQLIYWCFLENSPGKEKNLWFYMQKIDKYTKSVFSLVSLDYTYTYAESYIPTIVKEFKVTLSHNSVQAVNLDKIQECVSNWLNSVKNYLSHEAVTLLNVISSVKLLKSVKNGCQAVPENWPLIVDSLKLPYKFNLWQEFFESLMIDRVKDILSDNWNASFLLLKQEIDSLLSCVKDNRGTDGDLNLHSLIWQSDQDYNIRNMNDKVNKNLLMKIEAIFPKSADMCESVEKYISSLMQDITDICEQDSADEKIVALKNFQQHCCFHFVIRIIEYVSSFALSENSNQTDCVLMAKFLHGIPLFCPSLKNCLFLVDNKGTKWMEMKSLLQENSDRIWNKWILLLLPGVVGTFRSELNMCNNAGLHIKIIPKWDVLTVDENNENGEVVQSVVKVPCSVTFPLQHLLNELNVHCSKILPPKSVIYELVLAAVTEILNYYEECCQYSLPQVHYMQFMFDLMYLISLLIPVENKNALSKCQDTISRLETKIDPFDLDAISQYLMSNVKLYVNKTQAVYGLIAMNKTNTNANLGFSGMDDPNILNIPSQSVSWFSLLPITAPN